MGSNELLNADQNVVVLVPTKEYAAFVNRLAHELASRHGKLCYVSIAKSARVVAEAFQKEGIDTANFHFIDCITKSIAIRPLATEKKMPPRSLELKVQFVTNPSALTELDVLLFRTLSEENLQAVFFDSLSTLLLYNDELAVVKFAQHLMNKVRESNSRGVFLALREDLNSQLVKDLALFADSTLDLAGSPPTAPLSP